MGALVVAAAVAPDAVRSHRALAAPPVNPVVITFDDLPNGTSVTNQYASLGVSFAATGGGGLSAISGGSANPITGNSAIFYKPGDTQQLVSVDLTFTLPGTSQPAATDFVGWTPTDASDGSTLFVMTAYDVQGAVIGTASRTVGSSGTYDPAVDTEVSISVTGIHRVTFSGTVRTGANFAIEGDDLRFNALGAPPPCAETAPPAATFFDQNSADADWTSSELADATPAAASNAQATHVDSGGDPGCFRRVVHDVAGAGSFVVSHLRNGATYDPAASGSISSIGFGCDLVHLDANAGNDVSYALLLVQGGSTYAAPYDAATSTAWTRVDRPTISPGSFTRIAGSGPARPDFRATAAAMQFGFVSANPAATASPLQLQSGIDNWTVQVTQGPAPTGPDLVPSGSITLTCPGGTKNCKLSATITITNAGDVKAKKSRVTFYLSDDAALDAADLALGSKSVKPIKPGKSRSFSRSVTLVGVVNPLPYQGKYVIAVADSAGVVTESDETNNMGAHRIP